MATEKLTKVKYMIVFGNKQALQTNFIIKKETQLTSPFWFLKMDFSSVVGEQNEPYK